MLLAIACALLSFQEPTEEQARIFAILDRLDPVDTSKLEFVELDLGAFHKDSDGKPVHAYDHAFLLKDGDRDFTVRLLNLTARTYRFPRETHRPADLAAFAREEAGRLEEGGDDSSVVARGVFGDRARAVLLARACARRKLHAEVRLIWEALESLDEAVAQLADGFSRRLIREIFEADLTRVQIRDRHQAWLDCFLKAPMRGDVEARLTLLQKMIKEDDEQARRPKPRNRTEEIESLIFELRNESQPLRQEWISSGDGHLVRELTPEQESARPARRLVAIGLDAVPGVVALLEDPRPTRCVACTEDTYELVTLGAMAEFVLVELSGLEFTGEVEERRAAWRKWSKDLQEHGEEKTLAALVVRGGEQADAAAERLLKKWPGRVAEITRGAKSTRDPYMRKRMVALLGPFRDESVTAFLLEEADQGPELGARVMAGAILLDRGRREGLDALARDWREPIRTRRESPQDLPEEVHRFDRFIALKSGREDLARFLVSSGDLATLRSITKDLSTQPPVLRGSVLEAFNVPRLADLLGRCDPATRPAIEGELEAVLVRFLQDRARVGKNSWSRLCDQAGNRLVKLWPDRYPALPKGASRTRDRHWLAYANSWRARNGMEVVPEPARPDPRSKDPAIPNLVDRFVAEADAAIRGNVGEQLAAKGLGALAWIADALKTRSADRESTAELKKIAIRLANHVATTSLATGTWKAPRSLEDRLAGLKGKELTYEELVGVLLDAMNALPDKAGTATLQVERVPGLGVHVDLQVIPGKVDRGIGASSSWEVCSEGEIGGLTSGGGVRTVYDDVDDFRRYGTHLEEALKASFEEYFESTIELTYD